MRPHLEYERGLHLHSIAPVAGIDEVGIGPLAGPVVAAAVILPLDFKHRTINDSKLLTAKERESIYAELTSNPQISWSVALVESSEVDHLNILQASIKAMRLAVEGLKPKPMHVLIDGRRISSFPLPQTAIVKGDQICLSIAAASIIAKVTRDRLMTDFDKIYPAYGFARHKGYRTKAHIDALSQAGPCPIHRFSFRPVAEVATKFSAAAA